MEKEFYKPIPEKMLSRRDYFATNAPNEIPEWFEFNPIKRDIIKKPEYWDIENEEDKNLCRGWERDDCFDLPEHLKWFSDQLQKYWNERRELDRLNKVAKYFQWRKFYADSLIKELDNNE